MELLHGITHVLARFLERVELGLLFLCQERPDLRHRFVDDSLSLLHRILVDRDDLWPRLIEQRLDLGLLISREVQRLGQMLHRERAAMPVPAAVAGKALALGVSPCEAAHCDCARRRECK